jgi:hypothetical protein
MGGADSIDKHMRTVGFDWFPRELPCKSEEDRALQYDRIGVLLLPLVKEQSERIRRLEKELSDMKDIIKMMFVKKAVS